MPLTPRQLDVLDFVVQFIRQHRYAPTLREMADEFDLSRVTVLQHLEALEEKGYLERQPNKARGISVKKHVEVPESSDTDAGVRVRDPGQLEEYNVDEEEGFPTLTALPLAGYLTPDQTVRSVEKRKLMPVEHLFSVGEEGYLLEVRCNWLENDHILEGDYLVVDEEQTGESGDLVVVSTEEGETLVVRRRSDPKPELVPLRENEDRSTDLLRNAEVAGAVTGVVRTLSGR